MYFGRSSRYLWPSLSPQVSPGFAAKGFFQEQQRDFSGWDSRCVLCGLWHFWNFLGGLGVEGFCDVSVYIPPEEEALSLSCQASSIKGMNWWCVPTPPHLSITYIAVCLSSVPCKASLGSALQGWDEPCCLGQRPAPTALFLYQKNLFRPLLCVVWSLFYGSLSGGCESNSNCAFFSPPPFLQKYQCKF